MTSQNLAAQLEDIFNIPRDGSNIQDEESQEAAYADALVGDSQVSFEKKASELSSKLSEIPSPIKEEVEFGSTPIKSEEPKAVKVEEPPKQAPKPEEGIKNESVPKTDMASIIADAVSTAKSGLEDSKQVAVSQNPENKPSKPAVHGPVKAEVRPELPAVSRTEDDAEEKPVTIEPQVMGVEDEDDWLIESPSPRYSMFYEEKRKILPRLLRGGKLPIESLSSELQNIRINTQVDMYDHINIATKMTEIRQWQTRVMEIRGRVLSQYYVWKRAIILFQGLLARAEYIKPAIAQEGTNYNHMRDLEIYFTDLEYLFEFTKEMLANLASQFESLSRQVTLSMPLKGVERYEQAANQVAQKIAETHQPVAIIPSKRSQDLSSYDKLENRVNDEGVSAKKSNSNSTESKPKAATGWGAVR